MDSNFTNENDPLEYNLDIDDSDLHLTPVLRSSSSARVEPSSSTPNPVMIIPGPADLVQQAKQLKEKVFILDSDGALMSTQEYMQKVVEDVDEDDDFNSAVWISATNYMISTGGTVTGCTVRGTIHYKVLDVGSYGKNITVGAAMILANVSVFTPKTLEHHLNITKKNVVKVFRKDTISLA
ncbi:probable transmembrane ascorbate ferrireductase 4 [Tanacetum coccineum]